MHIKCNQYYLWYFYHLYFCSKCKGSAALFNYKYGVTCAWQTYHSHNPLSYTSATFNCPDFFHHLELKESNCVYSCTQCLWVHSTPWFRWHFLFQQKPLQQFQWGSELCKVKLSHNCGQGVMPVIAVFSRRPVCATHSSENLSGAGWPQFVIIC